MKGSQFIIELGDGETPEVFVAPCALNTKGINFTATANEQNIPDCDTPDDPMWVERTVQTLSGDITGAGTLAFESYDIWREWFLSGLERNVRARFNVAAPNGGHYFGSYILTTFNTGANQGELATIEVTMLSDGEIEWAAAA
jgi:hypothetical protein